VPVILYISGSGGLLERMKDCGPDVISVDQSVDISDAIDRLGGDIAVQGNLDPGILFGSKDLIEKRIIELVKTVQDKSKAILCTLWMVCVLDVPHVLNLGHGVLVGTPEENVKHYFEVARSVHERI